MPAIKRPFCCPDPRCTPVFQGSNSDDLSVHTPGESFCCFGRMQESCVQVIDGVEHVNDLRSCHYTQRGGVVSWHENAEDWKMLSRWYKSALFALENASLGYTAEHESKRDGPGDSPAGPPV